MKKSLILSCVILLSGAFVMHAHAADPKVIGKFGSWQALEFTENGAKVCYMVSEPVSAKGNYSKRDKIYALITHNPSDNTKDVFSYIAGYSYKSGEQVDLSIDGKEKFTLFTQDNTAWAPDAETDSRLANAIQQGSKMVVKGHSARGTLTTDTFSLNGSGSAYQKITQACGG